MVTEKEIKELWELTRKFHTTLDKRTYWNSVDKLAKIVPVLLYELETKEAEIKRLQRTK